MHPTPVNPNIRDATATNTALGYYAEDVSDPDFFIEGCVQSMSGEAILTFIVLAVEHGPGIAAVRGAVRGSEVVVTVRRTSPALAGDSPNL